MPGRSLRNETTVIPERGFATANFLDFRLPNLESVRLAARVLYYSLLATRYSVLFVLPFLAGCDTPDLRNVVFKPATEDPEAYKNALRAYFVTTQPREQPWGNSFLARQELVLDPDQSPMANLAVKLDGLESRADRKGFLALERLRPGFHALEVPAGDAPRRLSLPIEKGRMTLAFFELGRDGRLVVTATILPHGYVLTPHFKLLAQRHREMKRFLDALEARPDEAAFTDAIAPTYADAFGGRGDLLKARELLAGNGPRTVFSTRSAVAMLDGRKADVTLSATRSGHPALSRLSLEAAPTPEGRWSLVSIQGMNPFDIAGAGLTPESPLPAIRGSVARQKREAEELGRGLRGASRGSGFRPDESGVVERDPFSSPVDRAHPDQASPDFRTQPNALTGPVQRNPYGR